MIPLQYVHAYRDRHGKMRRYFRRPGMKKIPLLGEPGSDQFMLAYGAACEGKELPKPEIGASRTKPGTIAALTVAYYNSSEFKTLAKSTQDAYRNQIDSFREKYGSRQIAPLTQAHIKGIIAAKAETPASANNLLDRLRGLMQLAVAMDLIKADPTVGVKNLRNKTDGFKEWPEAHIERFRKHHKLGTRARLAFEILLNTIQRRGDVVRMGRQHIRDETLSIVQQKTGTAVDIPVLPDLREALDASPADNLTFLTTDFGKPFSAAGFGNWFREVCNEAGVPKGYSAHGLRKAGATRLADHGATEHELMAWGGWKTLAEVQRYTKAANRKRLAKSGGAKLIAGTSIGSPSEKVSQTDPQPIESTG